MLHFAQGTDRALLSIKAIELWVQCETESGAVAESEPALTGLPVN